MVVTFGHTPSPPRSLAPHPNDLTGSQQPLLVKGSHWLVLQGCNGCTLLLSLFRCWLFWGEVSCFLWESPWWSTFRAQRWGLSKAHMGPLLFFCRLTNVIRPLNAPTALVWPWGDLAPNWSLLWSLCVCLNLFLHQVAVCLDCTPADIQMGKLSCEISVVQFAREEPWLCFWTSGFNVWGQSAVICNKGT